MAIRLRTVNGIRVALCACETDAKEGDIYLDDGDHYALAAKFCLDWQENGKWQTETPWSYPEEWAAMETQKLRDAFQVHDELDKEFTKLRLKGFSEQDINNMLEDRYK